jgi:hypothetical protein
MRKRDRMLFKNLGIIWLIFLITGIVISIGFPVPKVTLLIDRSHCPADSWQKIVAEYTQIYGQQHREIEIRTVVLFSDLGVETRSQPPAPAEIAALSTYGTISPQRQQEIQTRYQNSRLLSCSL